MNYDEHPIDRIYVSWANTLDSAGEDSTEVRVRLHDEETLEIVRHIMCDVIEVGAQADLLKKWIFYGKTIEGHIPASSLPDWMLGQAYDNFDNHETVRLFHAVLGLVTEAAEMMEMLRDHLFSGMPIDVQNLIEETGDGLWYNALIAKYCGFLTLDEFMASNKAKLTQRYGEKWNQEGALNRDTAAEMEALDRGVEQNKNFGEVYGKGDTDGSETETTDT